MNMNKLYKQLIILLILMANNFLLVSQNSSADFKMPDIIPVSPESKGMGKFGDVPVGTYTGTPDISIPIYTIKAGKLSLPITLSYHATGIEVTQEATWVGLGWNLIAGGCISYIPVGGNDQSMSEISPETFQNIVNYASHDLIAHPMVTQEDGYSGWSCTSTEFLAKIFTPDVMYNIFKGVEERDVYSANFLNYSFKFIKHPINGSYFFMGQKNKCKIENCPTIDNNPVYSGFLITGEDGTIYRFESIEQSSFPASWVLTKIISTTGDIITLTYKKAITSNLPNLSESYMIKGNVRVPTRYIGGSSPLYALYLETIETKNELVTFESDPNRTDLAGAYKLNKITVKDKINQTDKFSYRFGYSYFIGSSVGGDFLVGDTNFSDDNKTKRLKLDSLLQVSGNSTNDKYAFAYYDSIPLPRKTSFAIDHWGHYNGKENSSTLIPGKDHTIIPSLLPLIVGNPLDYNGFDYSFYSLNTATRGASKNIDIASAGMLKSIQYPTKGKSVFTYEPHDYNNYKYYSAEDESSCQVSVSYDEANVRAWGTTPYPVTNVTQSTFTLTTGKNVILSGYSDFNGGALTIEGVNVPSFTSLTYQASDPNPVGHVAQWNDKLIWLNPGTYILKCTAPPTGTQSADMYPEIQGKIIYDQHYNYQTGVNSNHVGGGLRIKTVANYDENKNVVYSKRYSYVDESGNSSGNLLIPLRNFDMKNIRLGRCDRYLDTMTGLEKSNGVTSYTTAHTLFGNSYVSLSGYSTGNNVGYSRVVTETYDKNAGTNGKEISYYNNSPGVLYFDKIPFFSDASIGSLSKKVILNAIGDTLLVEKNNYGILAGSETAEVLNVYAESNYEGPTDCCYDFVNALSYVGRYKIFTYPTRNYWNTLNNKETTHYLSTGKVKETVDYTYNANNFSMSSSKTDASDGFKYTDITYTCDYPTDPILNAMVLKNQLTLPVVKSEYKNSSNQHKTIIDYSFWKNSFYAPSKISSKFGANPVDERAVFDDYDVYGNVTETHLSDGIRESYFYAYNNSLPIVKGVNIGSQTLNSVVQQALTTTGYSTIDNLLKSISSLPSSAWTTFNTTIRNNSSGSLITTYTYDPVFGMTSMTDPRGVTTNYSYDAFSRLSQTSNDDKNIISRYLYGYKNATGNGYTAPVATVTPGATTYNYGSTGTATLGSVSGGSGSYIYNWYLKNSTGTVLASNLNTTSTTFSFTCSQGGSLTIQCVITDNITGLSSTPSTTITSGAVTVNGSFYTVSGYTYPYTSLSKTGSYVTSVLVFLPTSSPMIVGNNYYVASVSTGFQPSASRTISYDTGGRTWNITFDPSGNVYCRIISGSNLPVGSAVAFGSLTYNL